MPVPGLVLVSLLSGLLHMRYFLFVSGHDERRSIRRTSLEYSEFLPAELFSEVESGRFLIVLAGTCALPP